MATAPENEALGFTTPGSGTTPITGRFFVVLKLTASSGESLADITFDYAANSAAANTKITWTYSIVGGGSGSASAITLNTTSGSTYDSATADFFIYLTSGETVDFTATLSGTQTGHGEAVNFDNINITAVPEPNRSTILWLFSAGFSFAAAPVVCILAAKVFRQPLEPRRVFAGRFIPGSLWRTERVRKMFGKTAG